jgi:hypothetical protein
VARFVPRPLYPRYPLDKNLGGSQSRSGRCGVEKNLLPRQELNPGRPDRSPSLYQLSYPSSASIPQLHLYDSKPLLLGGQKCISRNKNNHFDVVPLVIRNDVGYATPYSGGIRFESCPGNWLSALKFPVQYQLFLHRSIDSSGYEASR